MRRTNERTDGSLLQWANQSIDGAPPRCFLLRSIHSFFESLLDSSIDRFVASLSDLCADWLAILQFWEFYHFRAPAGLAILAFWAPVGFPFLPFRHFSAPAAFNHFCHFSAPPALPFCISPIFGPLPVVPFFHMCRFGAFF